jgi:type VI protein secretion system component VasK
MKYRIAAALLIFLCGAVMVSAGAGFACYALYAYFVPQFGSMCAALIAAAILLFVPVVAIILLSIRARRARKVWLEKFEALTARLTGPDSADNVTLNFLAGLAREKPLVAVLLAGLFGAAMTILRDKK